MEQIHNAKVDNRGNDTDDAKFHDLRKELLHGTCLKLAPKSAVGMTNLASLANPHGWG